MRDLPRRTRHVRLCDRAVCWASGEVVVERGRRVQDGGPRARLPDVDVGEEVAQRLVAADRAAELAPVGGVGAASSSIRPAAPTDSAAASSVAIVVIRRTASPPNGPATTGAPASLTAYAGAVGSNAGCATDETREASTTASAGPSSPAATTASRAAAPACSTATLRPVDGEGRGTRRGRRSAPGRRRARAVSSRVFGRRRPARTRLEHRERDRVVAEVRLGREARGGAADVRHRREMRTQRPGDQAQLDRAEPLVAADRQGAELDQARPQLVGLAFEQRLDAGPPACPGRSAAESRRGA